MADPVESPPPPPANPAKAGSEYRRFPRTTPKNASISCTDAILPNGGSRNLALRIVDVSFSGACIVTVELMPLGARLKARVVFEDGGGLSAMAEVCWSRSVQHHGKTYFLAGLNYLDRPEFLSGQVVEPAPDADDSHRSTNVHELKEVMDAQRGPAPDEKKGDSTDDALEAILGEIESEPLPLTPSDVQQVGAPVVTTAPPLPPSMMGASRRRPGISNAVILVASFLLGVALAFALAWMTGEL